jgi:hypothetical protein
MEAKYSSETSIDFQRITQRYMAHIFRNMRNVIEILIAPQMFDVSHIGK